MSRATTTVASSPQTRYVNTSTLPQVSFFIPTQLGDKRIPDGPSSSSTKVLPLSTPSAPRAMSSGDVVRGKGDPTSGRDRHRDHPNSNGPPTGSGSNNPQSYPDSGPQGLGSLRSRISNKEHPRSLPPQPSPANSYRPEPQRKDDDRDSRKRTVSGMHAFHHFHLSPMSIFNRSRQGHE